MDYIPKQYVNNVKACNEKAVKQWDSGQIDGSGNHTSLFNPGYVPLAKSELMEVRFLYGHTESEPSRDFFRILTGVSAIGSKQRRDSPVRATRI